MDDKAALEDIRDGGREGYKVIRERYEPRLHDYATYLPKKLAECVIQKVFAQFEKSIHSFDKESALSKWLYEMTDYAIDEVALECIHNGKPDGQKLGCTILHKHYVTSLYSHVEKYKLSKEFTEKVVTDVFVEFDRRILKFKKSSGIKIWLDKMVERIVGDYLPIEHLGLPNGSSGRLYNYVKNKRGVPIESVNDVVQEIFWKFFDNSSFKHYCSVSTWFARIANSVASEYLRKRAKEDYPREANENQINYDDDAAQNRLSQQEELKEKKPRTIRMDHHYEDETEEDTPLFDFLNRKYETEEHNHQVHICVEQVKAHLERESNTKLLECLNAHILELEGLSKQEIGNEIGRTRDATTQFMSTCQKKLLQYPPLQECYGIFLKMCLERVKAKLENKGSNDDILTCLQAHILKLQGKTTGEVANQIGKKSRETKDYLAKCKEKLMQHPAIPEECREWLDYLE